MTQLITRLSWNDPWSTPHHLAAKCVLPYLLLSSCCFHKQQLTFMHGTTHFILRLLNEDKQGIWHSIVPKMRTTNEHIGAGGLWPEMYGTSESHISPVVLYTIRKTLFCLKRAELFLFSTTFLSFLDDGRGTFSCDDVDGILCCVICCILNDGWLLAISLAWLLVVIVSKLQQQQQTEQFFRVVETPQREIEKQQDLPGRITILISWMPLPLEF